MHLTITYRNLQHLTFYQYLINPHIPLHIHPHIQPHIHPVIHAPIGGWALAAETVAVGGAAALQTPVVVLEEAYDHAIIAPVIPPMTLVSDGVGLTQQKPSPNPLTKITLSLCP